MHSVTERRAGVFETPLSRNWNCSRQHLKGTMRYHTVIANGRYVYCGCAPDFRGRPPRRYRWKPDYRWAENSRYK